MSEKFNITALCLFFCMGIASLCRGSDTVGAMWVGKEIWQVQYGVVDDRLSYLVFDGPKELPYSNIVEFCTSSSFCPRTNTSKIVKRSAMLVHPKVGELEIAESGRIFIVSEGHVSELKLHVFPDILDDFMNSKPELLSPDSFKKFVESKSEAVSPVDKKEGGKSETASKLELKKKEKPTLKSEVHSE